MLPNIFLPETTAQLQARIDALSPNSVALWGQMNVAQMLSHCQVVYQQILGENQDKPGAFMGWMLRTFFKKSMVNEVSYKPNLPTGPTFVRLGQEFDIAVEQQKLKKYIQLIQEMGPDKLATVPSLSLKNLSALEWNNLLYKHLDHHLRQFGV